MSQGRLQSAVSHYRAQLQAREASATQALNNAHANTLKMIQPRLDTLYRQIAAKQQAGEDVPLSWLYEQNRLQAIKSMISNQVDHYGAMAQVTTGQLQHQAVQLGQQAAQAQLQATVPAGIKWSFGIPHPAAIHNIVGATQAGSPLADLFNGFGAEAAKGASDALITGITLGQNPREIAPQVEDALDISRARALTISRTEMLRAYRGMQQATFQANSDTLSGWIWQADLSPRTCAACIAMNGTEHDLSESLDSHPNCFPAGTIISGPRVVGSTTRWYSGQIVDIQFASGNFLSVTPNHPILTSNGWVAAGKLHKGSNVIGRCLTQRPFAPINPNDYQIEAPIEEVAATFGETRAMFSAAMPTTAEDFHGDGIGSEVHIVRAYRHLRNNFNVALLQPFSQQQFCWRHSQLFKLARLRSALLSLNRVFLASSSIVGSLSVLASLFSSATSYHQAVSCGLISDIYPVLLQPQANNVTGDTKRFSNHVFGLSIGIAFSNLVNRQFKHALSFELGTPQSIGFFMPPEQTAQFQRLDETNLASMETLSSIFSTLTGNICLDRILKIFRRRFSGHVYNLQTVNNWYIANNIITHNCRCVMLPKTRSWDDILSPLGIDSSNIPDTSIDIESGSDWFDNQDAATQKAILGNSKYEAFKNGDFQLSDVVGHSYDKDWGHSIYEKPLKELVSR